MKDEELHLLLDKLRQQPKENEWLEFKRSNTNKSEIGKRISALSNSACLHNQPYGYLIFGVQDETKKIVGTKEYIGKKKVGNEELEHWIHQRLSPRIDFRVYDFLRNGEKISLLQIPATNSYPVRFEKKTYIRIGSITRDIIDFPEKERKIWLRTSNLKFEKQVAKAKILPEELNKYLNFNAYYELLNIPIPSRIDDKISCFESHRLIKKTGLRYSITNLGALVFAKNLNDFDHLSSKAIRLIRYKETNRTKTLKEHTGKKGYALAFSPLINFMQNVLPSNEFYQGALRKEQKAYPKLALRELISNALIHQDFEISGSGPMIEIFSDRIEITNPGKPIIDVSRFIDHHPQSRNEMLARLMRQLKLCEERGSGIDKVIQQCEHNQLPAPHFKEEESFIRIILYSSKEWDKMTETDKVRACYQHCVLKYVSGNTMTLNSLLNRFNLSYKDYEVVEQIITHSVNSNMIRQAETSSHALTYIPIWG